MEKSYNGGVDNYLKMTNSLKESTGKDVVDDLIDMLCDCAEGETENFRSGLNEKGRELFDKIDEAGQLIVTALDKLEPDKIELIRESTRDQYMVVFHNLSNHMMLLLLCKTAE